MAPENSKGPGTIQAHVPMNGRETYATTSQTSSKMDIAPARAPNTGDGSLHVRAGVSPLPNAATTAPFAIPAQSAPRTTPTSPAATPTRTSADGPFSHAT